MIVADFRTTVTTTREGEAEVGKRQDKVSGQGQRVS